MNDYELIYQVQNHQDGVAIELLFKKYDRMIWKYIHLYEVPFYDREDFHQEGRIMLHKAILTFDESKNKTFTRYFELILKRRFWRLLKNLPKYVIKEAHEISGVTYLREEVEFPKFLKSELEKMIYEKYFINDEKVKTITEATGLEAKQIYNTIYRIKAKLKQYY